MKRELLELLERISGLPVLVIGDLILDRYVWGDVDRISPEAPVPIVHVRRSEERLGGAANVARNLRAIGAQVTVCGLIGDDADGRTVLDLLAAEGIERDGVTTDRTRPTIVKTRVMAQRQQMLRLDREEIGFQAPALRESFSALADAHLDASKAVIVSDYGKGAVTEELFSRLAAAQENGRLGISAGRPMLVDPHPRSFTLYKKIPVIKPNRRETEAATGIEIKDVESARAAARAILDKWESDMAVVTLGQDGMVIVERSAAEPTIIATAALQVFDVSGAGDTVAALFNAALGAGASSQLAGHFANIGAGVVVSEVGTVPVNPAKLKREIEQLP